MTEIDLRDETNNLEPRIRRPIVFNIPNKSKDVNEQDRKEDLKGNLDITSSTEPMFAKSIRPMMMPKENLPHILESSEPIVTINIGRIDVRAIMSSPSEYIQKMPSLSLADYLKRRDLEKQ